MLCSSNLCANCTIQWSLRSAINCKVQSTKTRIDSSEARACGSHNACKNAKASLKGTRRNYSIGESFCKQYEVEKQRNLQGFKHGRTKSSRVQVDSSSIK